MITKNKVAIWSRLNVSISDCIITERSKRLGLSINAAVGVSATLAQLKERCDATFAAYVANPSSDKAWRAALEAATALEQALDRAAPAGANRSRRSADAEYDDDADNNPFAASRNNLSRHVGEEIQRVAGPMLEAAGGAGLGTVAMPLRLSTTELEICSRMNISPEDYLATKKRNATRR